MINLSTRKGSPAKILRHWHCIRGRHRLEFSQVTRLVNHSDGNDANNRPIAKSFRSKCCWPPVAGVPVGRRATHARGLIVLLDYLTSIMSALQELNMLAGQSAAVSSRREARSSYLVILFESRAQFRIPSTQ